MTDIQLYLSTAAIVGALVGFHFGLNLGRDQLCRAVAGVRAEFRGGDCFRLEDGVWKAVER